MTASWPWPQDTTEIQIRRIALMYRDELAKASPAACEQLDYNMSCWGQNWISDDSIINVEELVTRTQLLARFGIRPHQVRDWSIRYPDKVPVRDYEGRQPRYRLGDVLAFSSQRRH